TVEPVGGEVPAPGVWNRTTPSSDGSWTSLVSTTTLKPELRSVAMASAREKLPTSGTTRSFGPLETDRVTVEPFGARLFAGGSCCTTVSLGSFDSTSLRATAKPAPWSCAAACSYGTPTTGGLAAGRRACD